MNRKIKFRAWVHKSLYEDDNNFKPHMVGPFSFNDFDGDYCILFGEDICSENAIFLQFTGLHDKNGKEVWEGDIVRHRAFEPRGVFVVELGEYKDENGLRHTGWHLQNGPDENQLEILDCPDIEVIGNIYENQINRS